MATVGNLIVKLRAETAAFEKGMKRSRKSMSGFSRGVGALKKGLMGLGVYLGGRQLIRGFASVIRAANIQEKAEKDLAAALRITNDYTLERQQALEEYAAELQKVTVFGDEEILAQMAYAKNLGVTAEKLQAAAKAAIGLAAKFRLDLQTAMMLVGRASQGQTQMLTRYGIVLDETLSPQEKFNELLKIGAKSFALAAAETKTAAGAIKQLANAWGDFKEAVGEKAAPFLTKLAQGATAMLKGTGPPDWLSWQWTPASEWNKTQRYYARRHQYSMTGGAIAGRGMLDVTTGKVISGEEWAKQFFGKLEAVAQTTKGSTWLKDMGKRIFEGFDKAVSVPLRAFQEAFGGLTLPEGKSMAGQWSGLQEVYRGAVTAALSGKQPTEMKIERNTSETVRELKQIKDKMGTGGQGGLVFAS